MHSLILGMQNSEWCEPVNDSTEAVRDAKIAIERTFGWVSILQRDLTRFWTNLAIIVCPANL